MGWSATAPRRISPSDLWTSSASTSIASTTSTSRRRERPTGETVANFRAMVDYISLRRSNKAPRSMPLWVTVNNVLRQAVHGRSRDLMPNADVFARGRLKVKGMHGRRESSAPAAMSSGADARATTRCSTPTWGSSSTTSADSCRWRRLQAARSASRAPSTSSPSRRSRPSTSTTSTSRPAAISSANTAWKRNSR
jgi:hypothetical protein